MILDTSARAQLRLHLRADEGLRLKPYRDTVGKWTIGYGRNLTDTGISREEAEAMLDHDIDSHVRGLFARHPWIADADPVRQAVLANMAFNLGVPGLSKFVKTLEACQRRDYVTAAKRMLASKWASQVGARARRLARQMETGAW